MFDLSPDLIKVLFSWKVILDILFIGTAIFLAYRTLRRLGTWKIVAGVLIAIAIFNVSQFLDLKGVKVRGHDGAVVIERGTTICNQPENGLWCKP